MVYYNPHISWLYNLLYTLNNQQPFFFIARLESTTMDLIVWLGHDIASKAEV